MAAFLLLPAPALAGCNTRACDAHAAKIKRIKRYHDSCNTWACVRRVRVARARRAIAAQRRVIRPYRSWLAAVRWCESTNRYWINTGNGFYGAYQFTLSSWRAVGGSGYPHLAAPLEQDYRAVRLLHLQGRGAWPHCG